MLRLRTGPASPPADATSPERVWEYRMWAHQGYRWPVGPATGDTIRCLMQQQNDIGVAMDVRVGLRVASVGSRALAQLIDLVLLQILQAIIGCAGVFVVAIGGYDGSSAAWVAGGVLLLATLLGAVWFVGYEIVWEGQTPGKRWVGLRVVTEDGRVADAGAIVLRNAMRLVDFLPGGYLFGLIAMLGSAQSRRLGDLVAGTIVIAEEKAPATPRRWPVGLADPDVRLLETWFARVAALPPDRREALAAKLLGRLGWSAAPGATAVDTLEALCPKGG